MLAPMEDGDCLHWRVDGRRARAVGRFEEFRGHGGEPGRRGVADVLVEEMALTPESLLKVENALLRQTAVMIGVALLAADSEVSVTALGRQTALVVEIAWFAPAAADSQVAETALVVQTSVFWESSESELELG